MNEFKEKYKVDLQRKKGGEIIITEPLRNVLMELLKGNIEKTDVTRITGISDDNTIERLIEKIVDEKDTNLKLLYQEYISRKSTNFNGYNFRAEAIDMLRNDYSQSAMAKQIGVNRRSFSTKMKILQEENSDNELGYLLKQHADRKMKRKEITPEEKIKINSMLDEYEEKYPVGLARYESRNPLEVRLEVITKMLEAVDEMLQSGMTMKEISDRKIISESNYRKYRAEAKNLNIILNGRDRKEE